MGFARLSTDLRYHRPIEPRRRSKSRRFCLARVSNRVGALEGSYVQVIAGTRGELQPDPRHDPVLVVGMCYTDDGGETHSSVALLLRDQASREMPAQPPQLPQQQQGEEDRRSRGQSAPRSGVGGERVPMGKGIPRGDNGGNGRGGDAEAFVDSTPEDLDPTVGVGPIAGLESVVGAGAVRDGAIHRGTVPGQVLGPDAEAVDEAWGWGVEDAAPNGMADTLEVHAFDSEKALLRGLIATVRAIDPDVLVGFEIQGGSLGYVAERAAVLDVGLLREIARDERRPGAAERQDDEYGRLNASGIHVTGRVVINLWRVLRAELKLQSYTLESCAHAVLRRRLPTFPAKVLSRWARGGPSGGDGEGSRGVHLRWRAIRHAASRAGVAAQMMEQLDLVARTSEQARIFGIDFFSVLSRGSQYRVESMLLRLAHTQNFVMLSPSKEQVARQPAMECLPLVMEPESKMYTDPVAVLDFQSLYPSMVIAYNLCYSTCLGRVPRGTRGRGDDQDDDGLARDPVRLGCAHLALPRGLLPSIVGGSGPAAGPGVTCTPNGVVFAPPAVRPGVLPRLLAEILDTRVMVKTALKRAPPEARARRRALNARQFGLKLIANVTYGYTAAGFSGRMPMAELADAIVQCGRDTLEKAIRMVHANERWGARVVYGDTDSLFVHMPGRSVEAAHAIGAEIAAAVTAANPVPVTLKLEKVYSPCMLITKKRYVGHAFESPDQVTPLFDAKGIETVRRDSCPAVSKLMRASLRLLFVSKDLSLVKHYVQRQLAKVMSGRLPLRDFVFAKEVRFGMYSGKGPLPPAAVVAGKAMAADARMEPKHGERVRYVVVHGDPGPRALLIDMVVSPQQFIDSRGRLRINDKYYCAKMIVPALHRCLSLVGADVHAWLAQVPPPARTAARAGSVGRTAVGGSNAEVALVGGGGVGGGGERHSRGMTIDSFYLSRHCAVCGDLTTSTRVVCEGCAESPATAVAVLAWRAARLEQSAQRLTEVCINCGGGGGGVGNGAGGGAVECVSLDCPIYYERCKVDLDAEAAQSHLMHNLT